ncbi:FmdB family zinc ribbon protein [Pseudothermotoga thermarum]|uniref:Regulatory protein, FmdB family n=1 Tax=Pseudothermotoga thermarum DSM 5069 TaxID=688269 RepID=F7YYS6_9THEM|nr:FmdB family zinc ribbon protein [Pseudothermotoga thermarum]AEH51114.1 regulatory protein, FmdB family [Pseudothermotoga thermarum DSM 5069]
MPIYRYLCQSCKKEVTVLKGINDPDPKCPDCGQPMEKQIPKVQIKGGNSSCSAQSCSGCSGCSSK